LAARAPPNFTHSLAEIHHFAMKMQFTARHFAFIGKRDCMIFSSKPLAFSPRRMLSQALILALAAAFSSNAQASLGDLESNIDGIEIESQETEIEVELRLLDNRGGSKQQLQLQGEHALDDRWSIGAELELEREPSEGLAADTALARVKWRTPRNLNGMAFALQAGIGYSFGDNAVLTETDAYLGWARKDWYVVSRIDWDQLLQGGAEPEVGYRLRVARGVGLDITIGMEAAGDIWTGEPTVHRVGPYLELPLGDDEAPSLQIGAFAGLNAASPDMAYRMEIEFEF
jgi:hypothetical protein